MNLFWKRTLRTASSERFLAQREGKDVAAVDLHYLANHIIPYDQFGHPEEPSKNSKNIVTWQSSSQNLMRIATAIGSTSVLLDLPVKERIPDSPCVSIQSSYSICSCNGGNKECMRCGGTGHYRIR
jgi:hypothetical protein